MAIDASIPLQAKTFSLSDLMNDSQERQARQQLLQLQQQQAAMQKAQFARQQSEWGKADTTEANQRLAVAQASRGDFAGADSQYGGGAGDLGIHGVISSLKAEHIAQARQQYAAAIPVAVGAMGIADPTARSAFIQSHKADLVGAGWHPEEVDAAASNPTDANLTAIINKARSTEQILAQYDKTSEPYTLGQDQVRFVGGKEIARGPESIKAITTPEGGTTTVFGGAGHTGIGGIGGGSPDAVWSNMLGAEGGTNPDGSFRTSPKGAIGPAQVMPGTAPQAAALAGVAWNPQLYRTDAAYNTKIGKAYFQQQLQTFGGDVALAAAAYNAGPGRVQAALQKGGAQGWLQFVPKETRDYVRKVAGGGSGPMTIQGNPKPAKDTPDSLLSKGYRMKPDGTMEPIPGGPADPGSVEMPAPREMAKRNASYPKVTQAYRTSTQKIDQQIKDIQTLQKMPGLSRIVGMFDANTPNVSGPARAAQALYDKIVARGQFNELQDMRNSSPTGGALGSVSDSENRTLREAAAALNRNQDEGDFSARLDDYLSALQRSRGNLDEAYNDTYAYRLGSQQAAHPSDIQRIMQKYGAR